MNHPWRTRLAVSVAGLVALGLAPLVVLGPGTAGAAVPAGHDAGPPAAENFWLATPGGSLYGFGVPSYGSPGAPLNRPLVGVAATRDQQGYWLVASDGGVFSYGDAAFYGSTGNVHLNRPIVGLTATRDQQGYWLVASDGGVFSFGDAAFYGSTASDPGDPVERVVPTHSGNGYWVVQQNGTATAFGDAGSSTPPAQGLLFTPTTPGDQAVQFAFQQLGKPYIWGGNGPTGYDCSGLALASWSHTTGITFARVSNDQYHTAGTVVPMSELQSGDLVFWATNTADWTTVDHTAIYVGGNRIVEATGDHVQLNDLGQWGTGGLMPNGRRP